VSQLVINEFELVPAPPSEPEGTEPGQAEAAPAPAPTGHSPVLAAERVARWLSDRRRRVWAH
jgi:hypothetical protein